MLSHLPFRNVPLAVASLHAIHISPRFIPHQARSTVYTWGRGTSVRIPNVGVNPLVSRRIAFSGVLFCTEQYLHRYWYTGRFSWVLKKKTPWLPVGGNNHYPQVRIQALPGIQDILYHNSASKTAWQPDATPTRFRTGSKPPKPTLDV